MAPYESYLTVAFTILLGLAIVVYFVLDKRRRYWESKGFPCTGRSHMIYGDYKDIGRLENSQLANQRLYHEFKARKLPIGGVMVYLVRSAIVVDLELVKSVMVKDFANFSSRGTYNPEVDPLSGNMFFLEGQAWRLLRTKLTPTFSSGRMKMMFEIILEVANQLENYLLEKTVNGERELGMKYIMSGYTMDVIGTCALGIECNNLREENSKIREICDKIFNLSPLQMLWYIFLLSSKRLSALLKLKATHPDVERFFMDLVRKTVDYREKNNIQRNDFMNLLIQLKNSENPDERVTMNEIAAQVYVFFVAGFETSSTGLVYCLYELAMNQDIQDKLRNEIQRVCGDGKLTYETVSAVEYLNMVIDETFRKYPSGDFHRTSMNDFKIPGSDLTIPAKTVVIIPTYALHHDPEHYPDPDRFDPERFNATNRASRHSCVYIPFGEGPRICIGMRFGLTQTRAALITILRSFRLKPGPNTPAQLKGDPKSFLGVPAGAVDLLIERI